MALVGKIVVRALRGLRLAFVVALSSACTEQAPPSFDASWESLATHEAAPPWFRDAKFGIYAHWGVYSVPAYGDEWYPHWMHFTDRHEYRHHVETFGELDTFGYHDFVPMFTADKFDAESWARLFRASGARFAGIVAEHHDGFAMWDSAATPWNAVDKGPRRDVVGELAAAYRANGMRLVTTFHHARNLQRRDVENNSWDSHYPYFDGMPTTSTDPELRYLYGNVDEDIWLDDVWLKKVSEVIHQYQPDLIYFDSWLDSIPEHYRQRVVAEYFNAASNWQKDVVVVRKQDDLPLAFSVDDLEKSRKQAIDPNPWMTDETISYGSWSYTEGLRLKSAAELVHVLADIVSKNGVLMLNVSPMANGEIPDDQQSVLKEIGQWLDQFGEAIYDTRPWISWGEGPTTQPEGHFDNHQAFLDVRYSGRDVRYTHSGDSVYAIFLGTPETRVTLTTFANISDKVDSVTLLGSSQPVTWSLDGEGLHLSLPEELPSDIAPVVRIVVD